MIKEKIEIMQFLESTIRLANLEDNYRLKYEQDQKKLIHYISTISWIEFQKKFSSFM